MNGKNHWLKLLSKRSTIVLVTMVQLVLLTGLIDDKDETTVKALFVYNFTKYIEWPEQNISQQFRIGILGESAINDKLSMILKGKKIYNRTVEIKEIKSLDEIGGCQILYITKNTSEKLKQVLDRYSQNEMLIVTEEKNMAVKGAGINIIEKDQKIRFEMNNTAIKKAGLKVANQLYELAIVIQ